MLRLSSMFTVSAKVVRNLFYTLFLVVLLWTGWTALQPVTEELVLVENPELVLFGAESCPHCQNEKDFLREFSAETGLRWNYYDIVQADNLALYNRYQSALGLLERSGTPFTVIPAHPTGPPVVFVGFDTAETTGVLIKQELDRWRPDSTAQWLLPEDLLDQTFQNTKVLNAAACDEETDCEVVSPYSVSLPWLGTVDFATWALPTATIVLGLIDGFNPCAMWVLVVLLTLLIAMKDKRKMWLIGGIFIFVSAVVYYVFIVAQNMLLQFLGLNFWILKAIGLLAVGAGLFYLYEFLTVEAGVCTVTNTKQKQKILSRMKLLIQPKVLPATLLGVAALAFSVNLIELACTAGLPVIFNGLLQFWEVPTLAQHGYISLYILMYMLDDIIVFAIAVKTLQLVSFSGKFSKASNLIGGVLMLILGTLLIYNPSLLSF